MHYHRIFFQFDTTRHTESTEQGVIDTYIREHCSSLQFVCWSLDSAREFMRANYPTFAAIFDKKLSRPIVLCDFFRYILMYHFGGVYTDIDFVPIRSFDDFLQRLVKDVSYTPRSVTNPRIILSEEWHNSKEMTNTIHNGILISLEPFHPFWLKLAHEVYTEVQTNNVQIETEDAVYNVSGPKKLCKFYCENERHFTDVCVLPHYYFCPYLSYEENEKKEVVVNMYNNARLADTKPKGSFRWVFFNIKDHANFSQFCPVSYFVNVFMNTGSMWKS